MGYKVYHFDMGKYHHSFGKWYEIRGYSVGGECNAPSFPEEYELVAEVDAADMSDVYRLTNNIEDAWTRNAEVKATGSEFRSTSCGDVVVTPDGKSLRCASVGWEEI